ncbi:MAG TPA: hypothetical protein P5186_13900 [Candidatus Paceibacterota bacterium]|nr:hypothetical protein [Candidatus Paceibacterota bacterium]HRZ99834.1 hypothetical protein [Candidatus Paceibacterota bacterium]
MGADRAKGLGTQSRRWLSTATCSFFLLRVLTAAHGSANQTVAVWDTEVQLREGFGYKDNLLYDPEAREHSSFFSTGLEASLSRFSNSGHTFLAMIDGEDIRYPSGETVDKEQTLFATLQYLHHGDDWKWAWNGTYVYQDQMFDSSATETNLSAVRALGHLIEMRPSLTRSLGPRHRLELQPVGARQLLEDPLDDYWEGGAQLTYGCAISAATDLALAYEYLGRPYDAREKTDADGFSTGEDGLTFHEHAASLAWRRYWDDQRKWRTLSKIRYERNLDNAAGYFNYHRYQFSHGMRFRHRAWEASLQFRLNYYDYDQQTASSDDDSRRHKFTSSVHARIERQWTKWLGSFLDYEYESSISNTTLDEYGVNVISAGMSLEF